MQIFFEPKVRIFFCYLDNFSLDNRERKKCVSPEYETFIKLCFPTSGTWVEIIIHKNMIENYQIKWNKNDQEQSSSFRNKGTHFKISHRHIAERRKQRLKIM